MKKKMLIVLALLLVIPGLLLFASCGKQTVKADVGEIKDKLPEQQSVSSASESAAGTIAEHTGPSADEIKAEELKAEKMRAEEERKAKEKAEAMQAFVNEDVCFDFDSAILTEAAQNILKKKASYLEKYSGVSVTIEGHCDERGTNEYNLALGDRRAESAKNFLINLGIASSRLKTISYGEEKPLDTGHDEEAWSKNRRAHFII